MENKVNVLHNENARLCEKISYLANDKMTLTT
jgi:hypothetical protein